MMTWVEKNLIVLILGAFSLVAAPRAGAQGNPNDYLHSRTYVGVVATSISVSNAGLFNGQNYSLINSPSYELDLIPTLSQNFGYGILAGHREEAYALEVGFWQSNHTASFGPASLTSASVTTPTSVPAAKDVATYYSVNVDFKRYFLTELQLQPFVNLGVCFPWITVNNASENQYGQIGTATLAGLGLSLGLGVEYYLTPNFSVSCGGYERWASFDQVKGNAYYGSQYNPLAINGNATSDDGSGLIFMVGTTVGFQ